MAAVLQHDSVDIFTLQSSEIDDAWSWIERYLQMVESPPWKPEHVRADLKAAKAQLWALLDERSAPLGIVVTRIENYHDVRTGLLWIAAGRGVEHSPLMLYAIEGWFKSMGCARCELDGRLGWQKVLPDYQLKRVVLGKELR